MMIIYLNWLNLNKSTHNIEKTIFMTFGKYKDSVPTKFSVQIKEEIKRIEHRKYIIIFELNLKLNMEKSQISIFYFSTNYSNSCKQTRLKDLQRILSLLVKE